MELSHNSAWLRDFCTVWAVSVPSVEFRQLGQREGERFCAAWKKGTGCLENIWNVLKKEVFCLSFRSLFKNVHEGMEKNMAPVLVFRMGDFSC